MPAQKSLKLKRATMPAIRKAAAAIKSRLVPEINKKLKEMGYDRTNAKQRDKALKSVENNHPKQHKSPGPRPNNGGARKNAGRKKGAATTKTREIADQLAADGLQTPLEYMLEVMRTTDEDLKKKHDSGEIDTETYLVKLQANMARRDNFAEKAAPYIHPRLASIQAKFEGSEHDRWIAMMEEANQL